MAISYIPAAHALTYDATVMGRISRKVHSWKLSNTLNMAFCIGAIEEAPAKYGKLEIFNTDQGSQFTSATSRTRLKATKAKLQQSSYGVALPLAGYDSTEFFGRPIAENCSCRAKNACFFVTLSSAIRPFLFHPL